MKNISAASNSNEAVFNVGDSVVYPLHGVGQITNEEVSEVAGNEIKLYVISFSNEKMVLRIPKRKAMKVGLRHISSENDCNVAAEVLTGEGKVSRGIMWSKRAAEYTRKIDSGDMTLLAEVLRDLHRSSKEPNRSHSERALYEKALDRFVNEYAAVNILSKQDAQTKVMSMLNHDEDEEIMNDNQAIA